MCLLCREDLGYKRPLTQLASGYPVHLVCKMLAEAQIFGAFAYVGYPN